MYKRIIGVFFKLGAKKKFKVLFCTIYLINTLEILILTM